MALPSNTLSTRPIVSAFLPPRTVLRNTPALGLTDYHMGPIALSNPSQGISYQLWSVRSDGHNILLSAPNTPEFVFLANTPANWVAIAFDQNANVFIAYTLGTNGTSFYYWFDTTLPGYRTTALPTPTFRVFATMDDPRPIENSNNDIILAYTRLGTLYYRQQRDRFGVEYNLGAAPGNLVQMGMSHVLRLQFAFQNVTGNAGLPPQEWNPALGINEPA